MKKLLKNLGVGLIFLIAVRFGVFVFQGGMQTITASGVGAINATNDNDTDAEINRELAAAVAVANESYPRVTASGVRVERMTAGNRVLTYHKTVLDMSAKDFDAKMLAAIRPQIIAEACQSQLKQFFRKGVSIQNRFSDAHGVLIDDFTVVPADCES